MTINAGSSRASALRKNSAAASSFRLWNNERRWRKSAHRERLIQRIDRRRVGREQHGAIEDNGDDVSFLTRFNNPCQIDRTLARQIAGAARHSLRHGNRQIASGVTRETAQQRAQVLAAAFAEITEQDIKLIGRQRRRDSQPRIVAVLAGQHRKDDTALARQHGQPLDAVCPPIKTAEQADQNHLGVRADPVDPQVDRHRMPQLAQMREPHTRQAVAFHVPRGRKPREIAVDERQHGDVARRLAEIDRFDEIVERRRTGREQMH